MQTDEATLRKTVAKNIAQYRKAHHDTQLDLATKLNYSDKSVSKWERGESLPDVYILSQIAELYGVSVSALIGEIQPPKESKPHYHMFILLLSLALTMAVATLLFSMFMICKVDYPAWMFFVYALPVCSIICIVFTSLWWGILWQGVSVSALIWTLGLSLYLSFELENVSLIFLVCAALQVLTLLWEGFRKFLQRSRGLPDGETKPVSRSE
ncbi:MAG: helix-turn-helix domain-containing protein [Clostridiales bacterium]|mgnify:FL=1|nr:helix-turn-helix domain-containing protein [Clostridiales bacterium]MDD6064847.1 helix-turn-helix domain-containing protein [Clostridiales bacterium]MDD7487583.1 helix-turn-helix domain-containing protein [Clostridiales bacterium]MDY2691909.1 helix-turn-helix domain-containing protein [Oscillospiraceae bacterium]